MRLQVVCGGHSLRLSAVQYGDVGFSHSLHNLYAHDYDVERSMLENFTHYTSINSQPSFDSISTAGQHNVAMDIRSDASALSSYLYYVIIFVLCVGGYKACRAGKEIGRGQAPRQIHTIHQQRYQVHEPLRYRAKPNASDNP